jgi:hypothetical protein
MALRGSWSLEATGKRDALLHAVTSHTPGNIKPKTRKWSPDHGWVAEPPESPAPGIKKSQSHPGPTPEASEWRAQRQKKGKCCRAPRWLGPYCPSVTLCPCWGG